MNPCPTGGGEPFPDREGLASLSVDDPFIIPSREAGANAHVNPTGMCPGCNQDTPWNPGCFGPPYLGTNCHSANLLRPHRPAYPRGGVLAQVCGHRVEDAGRLAHRLRRSLQGQSWAEKSLKNGRILVGFQNLRKPQDAKGPCFPRNSPSRLPEWGSGGRWFESSRPDIRKSSCSNQLRLDFFSILGLIPTPGAELRAEIRLFRTTRHPSSAA